MALTISKGGQIVAQGSPLKLKDLQGGRVGVRGSGSGEGDASEVFIVPMKGAVFEA